jgi:Na+/proline symporter
MTALEAALYFVGPTLVAYAILGVTVRASNATEYLTGGGSMGSRSYFAMVCGSSVSLGGTILAFLGLGYALPWVAILATATWVIGFWIHFRAARSFMTESQNRDQTLHGLLGTATKSDAVRVAASFASIFGFAGAYGVEMVAITKLTAPLVGGDPIQNLVILAVLVLALALYMYRGGILAVARTDALQLPIFFLAIAFSTYFILKQVHSPAFALRDNFALSSSSFPAVLCAALIVLNVPWQLVDMSQWQRTFSCKDLTVVRKGLTASAVGITISWLLLIFLGTVLHEVPLENSDPIQTFVKVFADHPAAYAVFLVACVAALLSTADAYVIAATQSFYRDLVLPAREATGQLANGSLKEVRKISMAFVIFPPFVAFGASQIVPDILGLFFLVFAAQLSLVPVAFASLIRRVQPNKLAALSSILAGLFCSLSIFLYSLVSGDQSLFFWSPIATLGISALTYAAFRR